MKLIKIKFIATFSTLLISLCFINVCSCIASDPVNEFKSRVNIYCDKAFVDVPSELKDVSVTIKSASIESKVQKEKKSGTVKLFATPFWEANYPGKNIENIDATASHKIQTVGLLNLFKVSGVVLNAATFKPLPRVNIKFKDNTGSALAETSSGKQGEFDVWCWGKKKINNLELAFNFKGFLEKKVTITGGASLRKLVMLKPKPENEQNLKPENEQSNSGYRMVAVRPENGLGTFIKKLNLEFEQTSRNGVVTRLKMIESAGLYSILSNIVETNDIVKCRVKIIDKNKVWKDLEQDINPNRAEFLKIAMPLVGKAYTSGYVNFGNLENCRVWLFKFSGNQGSIDHVNTVLVDGNGAFKFRKKVEKPGKYRLAITWDAKKGSKIIPVWIDPELYEPVLLGKSDQYTLGMNKRLKVADDYLKNFEGLEIAWHKGKNRDAIITPEYEDRCIQSIVDTINKTLNKSNLATAMNIENANSFKIKLVNDDSDKTISVPENKFKEGMYLSLEHDTAYAPIVLSTMPKGRQSTIKRIRKILINTLERMFPTSDIEKPKLLLIFKEWMANETTYKALLNKLNTVSIPDENSSYNFSDAFRFHILKNLRKQKKYAGLKYNMILLLDSTFLDKCSDTSFNPNILKDFDLGKVYAIIFSDSYTKNDETQYMTSINRLRGVFDKISEFKHQIVNPLDKPDLAGFLNDIIIENVPKDYAWTPIRKNGNEHNKTK